jgi:hypothetical protein
METQVDSASDEREISAATQAAAQPMAAQQSTEASDAASDGGIDHRTELKDDSLGSSARQDIVANPTVDATTSTQRPTTHLQQGIRKRKTYSDGTIRYNWKFGLLTHVGEPQNLEEALQNKT